MAKGSILTKINQGPMAGGRLWDEGHIIWSSHVSTADMKVGVCPGVRYALCPDYPSIRRGHDA